MHVERQQALDIVVGRCVILPQLGLPEPVALKPSANKVGMHHIQRRFQPLQITCACETKCQAVCLSMLDCLVFSGRVRGRGGRGSTPK